MPVSWGRSPAETNHEQICVVDDDESVADSLKSLFEAFGYEVRSYVSISSPMIAVARLAV